MIRSIAIIAAVSENSVIGRHGQLPWHIGADLKRFRALTWGNVLIMGRRTYTSIGRPLPGRRSIVLTTRSDFMPEGVEIAKSLDAAIAMTEREATLFLIGGAAVYDSGLPRANKMYLTRVHAEVEGDVFFPAYNPADWICAERQRYEAESEAGYAFSFETYERVGKVK